MMIDKISQAFLKFLSLLYHKFSIFDVYLTVYLNLVAVVMSIELARRIQDAFNAVFLVDVSLINISPHREVDCRIQMC